MKNIARKACLTGIALTLALGACNRARADGLAGAEATDLKLSCEKTFNLPGGVLLCETPLVTLSNSTGSSAYRIRLASYSNDHYNAVCRLLGRTAYTFITATPDDASVPSPVITFDPDGNVASLEEASISTVSKIGCK